MKKFTKFNFKELFVLDLANNHQGNVSHGARIIRECAAVAKDQDMRVAIKFQFRDLPAFIHSNERKNQTNKHTSRFLSTRLDWSEFEGLLNVVRGEGLISMCTPFDEKSVDKINELGFDLIKVASCSATDWPLLDKIADGGLPIIVSTGGLKQSEVDELVSFFSHRGCDFALMHCVSIYPTPDEACNLSNIAEFKERYPGITVGWSTHEPPVETQHVGIAAALGAEMFERHVGVETEEVKLNAYSSTPSLLSEWFSAYRRAKILMGSRHRSLASSEESKAIAELTRGVYARERISPGEEVRPEQVYFAFPCLQGQIPSGAWKRGIIMNDAVEVDGPLTTASAEIPNDPAELIIKKAIHEVKALLAYARVTLTHNFTTEYSHHYGVLNFRAVGVILINIINRDYAKKVLVQLPGQRHPSHYHKLKEETFIVLWGVLISDLDGREHVLKPGDTLTVPPGVWHNFRTETGCVFEEISTTAYSNDSIYRDSAINAMSSRQRKTTVDHWGRFQILEQLRGMPLQSG